MRDKQVVVVVSAGKGSMMRRLHTYKTSHELKIGKGVSACPRQCGNMISSRAGQFVQLINSIPV